MGDIIAGSILWLPSAEACMNTNLFVDPWLDDGSFNHPVMILRKNHKQETAFILLVRLDTPAPFHRQRAPSDNAY